MTVYYVYLTVSRSEFLVLVVLVAVVEQSSPFNEAYQHPVTVPGALLIYYMKQTRINQAKQDSENTRLREELCATNDIQELRLHDQLARMRRKK